MIVAAHGNFSSASCIETRKTIPIKDVEKVIKDEMSWSELHKLHNAKRIKPDIVFFGESLPERFFSLSRKDFRNVDLVLVLGTSLQVYPFASLAEEANETVPHVLINKERVGRFKWDGENAFFMGKKD